jgi:hypothetical protein
VRVRERETLWTVNSVLCELPIHAPLWGHLLWEYISSSVNPLSLSLTLTSILLSFSFFFVPSSSLSRVKPLTFTFLFVMPLSFFLHPFLPSNLAAHACNHPGRMCR